MAIKAVVFDLGRVLIDFDWRPALERVAGMTKLSPSSVEEAIVRTDLFLDFESGRVNGREFYQGTCDRLKINVEYQEFVAAWNSIFTGEVKEIADIARSIIAESDLKVGVLSNTDELHVEYLKTTWPLMSELPNQCLSNEIGVRKPARNAYKTVLDRLMISANEALFVDDLKENIEAAREIGMHALWVTDRAEAAARLKHIIGTRDVK